MKRYYATSKADIRNPLRYLLICVQILSAFLAAESIKFFRNLIYLDLLRGQEQVSGRRDIQCHYKKRNSFYRIKAFWIM